MDICLRLFCVCVVLYLGSGLATGWSPVRGVLPTVYRIKKLKKRPKSNKKTVKRYVGRWVGGWVGGYVGRGEMYYTMQGRRFTIQYLCVLLVGDGGDGPL
jgi:hypothetical protein